MPSWSQADLVSALAFRRHHPATPVQLIADRFGIPYSSLYFHLRRTSGYLHSRRNRSGPAPKPVAHSRRKFHELDAHQQLAVSRISSHTNNDGQPSSPTAVAAWVNSLLAHNNPDPHLPPRVVHEHWVDSFMVWDQTLAYLILDHGDDELLRMIGRALEACERKELLLERKIRIQAKRKRGKKEGELQEAEPDERERERERELLVQQFMGSSLNNLDHSRDQGEGVLGDEFVELAQNSLDHKEESDCEHEREMLIRQFMGLGTVDSENRGDQDKLKKDQKQREQDAREPKEAVPKVELIVQDPTKLSWSNLDLDRPIQPLDNREEKPKLKRKHGIQEEQPLREDLPDCHRLEHSKRSSRTLKKPEYKRQRQNVQVQGLLTHDLSIPVFSKPVYHSPEPDRQKSHRLDNCERGQEICAQKQQDRDEVIMPPVELDYSSWEDDSDVDRTEREWEARIEREVEDEERESARKFQEWKIWSEERAHEREREQTLNQRETTKQDLAGANGISVGEVERSRSLSSSHLDINIRSLMEHNRTGEKRKGQERKGQGTRKSSYLAEGRSAEKLHLAARSQQPLSVQMPRM